MPKPDRQDTQIQDEIAASLKVRATELWGPERAEALGPLIEQTASHILQISRDPAPPDEEPGFYF